MLSKSASTWKYWNEDLAARKVELGREIGDGLDNQGDHLYLIKPNGEQADFVAWGNDTGTWPIPPSADLGESIERLVPGFDTNTPLDWHDIDPPSPGL